MTTPNLNTVVRLTQDVPTLWLSRGEVGVVRSVWLAPANYYEVEFRTPAKSAVRALLNAEMHEVVEPTPVMAGRYKPPSPTLPAQFREPTTGPTTASAAPANSSGAAGAAK